MVLDRSELAIAAVVVATIACTHPAAVPVAAAPSNKVALVHPGRPSEDALDYLPVTSELVAGIDFQHLQRGALWQRFVEPELAKNLGKLAGFKSLCGFDPFEAVTTIAVGASELGQNPDVTLVIQGPERVAMSGCMTKLGQLAPSSSDQLVHDGADWIATTKDGKHVAVTFVGDHTMLVIEGPNADKAKLARVAGKRASLRTSPAFSAILDDLDRTRTAWFVVNGSSHLLSNVPLPSSPRVVFGTLDAADGLALDLRVRMVNPVAAAQLNAILQTGIAQARSLVDQIDATIETTDVHVSARISAAKLASILGLFRGATGATGGLGGAPTP